MICDNCKTDFSPRRQGRRQRFCPGGKCRGEFYAKARAAGAQVLRKNGEKKSRIVRLDLMTPAERRIELGRAALRLGIL